MNNCIKPQGRGRCEKCNREFLSLPNDLIDHYGFGDQRECGGRVIPETSDADAATIANAEPGK